MQREAVLVLQGPGRREEWPLRPGTLTIGRASDCDIVLTDRRISRRHAQIRWDGTRYWLVDLGSKNGTFVNGQELMGPYALRDGDEIQLALCYRLLFLQPASERKARLRLDKAARRVWIGDEELVPPLSPAQYRLLELLYDRAGQVCSREEIVRAVWPEALEEGVSEEALDAVVRRLRRRLAQLDPHHQYVVTVRGHGFRLDLGDDP